MIKRQERDSKVANVLTRDDYIRLFNEMPMAYAIYDVKMDSDGSVKDIVCIFASNRLMDMMGLDASDAVGRSILENDFGNNFAIKRCMRNAAYEGKHTKETFYSEDGNRWISATFDQAAGEGRCAVIFEDVTKEKLTSERIGRVWRTDDLIISCIKLLHGGRLFDYAIDEVFRKVGSTINATRIYLLEKTDDGTFSVSHEWVEAGIESKMADYQKLSRDKMTNWEQEFLGATSFIVDDIETLRNNYPRIYSILAPLKVKSLVEVPVNLAGQTVAYLGTMGQDNQKILDVRELMETVSYFIASEFNRRSLMKELERKSIYDSLCGVKNRNAMEQDVRPLRHKDISVGVIYGDANGLKTVNDNQGHEAGDALLKSISRIMVDRFGNDSVYRAGGDEFVIILPEISQEAFTRLYEGVKADFERAEGLSVSLGCSFTQNSADIEKTMREADKMMYENKANYYRKNNRRKNRE
jgi:diguanylate cyclase (GGDEF)-like protein